MKFINIYFLNGTILAFLLCCFGFSNAQTVKSDSDTIYGTVFNKTFLTTASGVKVQNIRTYQVVISDVKGHFHIGAHIGDTLLFNSLSYYPNTSIVIDSCKNSRFPCFFFLNPRYIKLETVEIVASKPVRKPYDNPDNVKPASIMNPLSYIYEHTSSRNKSFKKLKQQMSKDNNAEYLKWRFSNPLIFQITRLTGKQLDFFINYCSFDEDFARNASDYDFLAEVRKKFDEYRKTVPILE